MNTNGLMAVMSGFIGAGSFIVSGTLIALRARHVRELTRSGYDYRAVARAIEQERRAHPLASEPSNWRSTMVSIGVGLGSIVAGTLSLDAHSFMMGFPLATAAVAGLLLSARAVVKKFASPVPGVKGRLPRAIESWMFRRFAVKNTPRAISVGEATVIAIGETINDLWEGLPPAARERFPNVPMIASKLEEEAMRLRERPGSDRERLRTVVAAMEALRLDLLRVSNGTLDPSALTAQLDAAREVSEHVDAIVHGRRVVDAVLRDENPTTSLPGRG